MPTYSEYEKEIYNLGGKLDYLKLNETNNFEIMPSRIKEQLKKGYDLLILCNPNNPTSTALTNAQIEDIASSALDSGTFIIIDETYVEFCDNVDEISSCKIINKYNNIFIIRGISKFFGTPGLRLGYGLSSNNKLIEKINEDANPWFINIFAAKAAETVFKDNEYIKNTNKLMKEEKEFLFTSLSKFKNLKVYNPSTNFILCRLLDESISSLELSHKLLEEAILIRDTNNVLGLNDSYFRVCILDRNSNAKLIHCLEKYIK
jgi:threonine-phosphate decarboxylase